ncbi:SoxR reducing system RseC family protein [candidate division KSB1 bacterium]|nr:SoxR reducing system RseC family protein [candidate division KSB1 bacterium]
MRHCGKIIELNGVVARVQLVKSIHCAGCTACDMFSSEDRRELNARNLIQAQIGDLVEIEVPPGRVIQSSLLIFLMPVIGILVGYWIGAKIASFWQLTAESGGILGALGFLVLTFGLLYVYDKRYLKQHAAMAQIVSQSPAAPAEILKHA